MAKDKVVLVMPGEIGFYLKGKLPDLIVNRQIAQKSLKLLFNRKVEIPLQFMAIAPYLIQAGYRVVIIDGRLDDAQQLLAREIDDSVVYVGITALTGSMIGYGLLCAEVVRRLDPSLPIVWGGVHVTLSPDQALETSNLVDIVVRGEGEFTCVDLAKALSSDCDLSGIEGISWRCNGKIVHNPDRPFMDFEEQLPFDFSLIDGDRYDTESLLYQSERGCPHRCAFCDVVIVHRRKFRQKSAQQVLVDLKNLYDRFHPKKFHFVDDCFFADLKRANEIIDGLIELNMDVTWHASCRVQYTRWIEKSFWEKAKRSGLIEVYVGAESASQPILDYIAKDCTVEDIHRAADHFSSAGILMWTNFMTGFPVETRKDLDKTIELIDYLDKKHQDNIRIGKIFMYAPCPGTPLHNEVVKAGFVRPAALSEWGSFRIGDMSHTTWHKDVEYMASASLCSEYGRNRVVASVAGRIKSGLQRYSVGAFLKLLVLKIPQFARGYLSGRAEKKWRNRDFTFTWDMRLLRWINITFDSW